jgi:hypothetical protein
MMAPGRGRCLVFFQPRFERWTKGMVRRADLAWVGRQAYQASSISTDEF